MLSSSKRPPFSDIFLRLALDVAQRSQCKRASVGCVITSTDHRKVLAFGYNGGAAGQSDECTGETGSCGDLHAEMNAIINCDAPRSMEKLVYCTHGCCIMCAKALINLGNVERFFYLNDYRDNSGLMLIQSAGIGVIKKNVEEVLFPESAEIIG